MTEVGDSVTKHPRSKVKEMIDRKGTLHAEDVPEMRLAIAEDVVTGSLSTDKTTVMKKCLNMMLRARTLRKKEDHVNALRERVEADERKSSIAARRKKWGANLRKPQSPDVTTQNPSSIRT